MRSGGRSEAERPESAPHKRSRKVDESAAVGAGILLSRITGLARDVSVAAFLGTGLLADAYWAAIKIPNIVRNLLGEGTLSAAFVPVYSEILEREGEAGRPVRLASSILGLVLSVAVLLSALGVILAPWITQAVMFGASEQTRQVATDLVRILFPMSGVLVVAAWCLGVLNSHGRFFLPFVAPVFWNLAQIGGLFLARGLGSQNLAHALAWSALAGSLLQLGVQLPAARRLAGTLRPAAEWTWEPVRRVARNTLPVVSSQGIFQISTLVDISLATLVGTSAMSALGYSQRLVYLPISLFGISVAAASLPDMSRNATAERLRPRLANSFFRILFFVLPAAAFLILFGDLVVRVVYQRNEFSAASTVLVSTVLATYALGLVASSSLKLFASGFHALQDTRTPMRLAAVSVATGITLAVLLTTWARSRLEAPYGAYAATGIVLGGVIGSWLNLLLMWRSLAGRIGRFLDGIALRATLRLAAATAAACLTAGATHHLLSDHLPVQEFGASLLLLLSVLAAGAVPYLIIARRPPIVSREVDAGD